MVSTKSNHRRGKPPLGAQIMFGAVAIQVVTFLMDVRHISQIPPVEGLTSSMSHEVPSRPYLEPTPMSQQSFTEDMTFHGECRTRQLFNDTWGESIAPFVDKVGSKLLVERMETSVKIVPNIAIYDSTNISDFTPEVMRALPDAIIKPAQGTGHTARLWNQTYSCFKNCKCHFKKCKKTNGTIDIPWRKRQQNLIAAHAHALKSMNFTLENVPDSILAAMEPQYKYVPRRVVVEEHLPMETMKEYHWWTVNGQPVFACVRCDQGGRRLGSYFSTSFHELEIGSFMDKCIDLAKPKTWNRMLSIVKKMGENIPGVVCIDLYANDEDVYFSEFTFTRHQCREHFQPIVADGLLYSMSHGLIESHLVTSEYVEKTIADRSWIHVSFEPNKPSPGRNMGLSARGYPSSLDLCRNQTTEKNVTICTQQAISASVFPLHCMVTKGKEIAAVGLLKHRTFKQILVKVDWCLALGLAILWLYLNKRVRGGQKEREYRQVWNCVVYLIVVVFYKSQQAIFSGLLAPSPLWTTVVQSYEAFTIVHPVTSPAIAVSHFGTYWIAIAAFRSKTLSSMLFWWFCYEVVTSFVNEFTHFAEEDDSVRCMRVSFILHAKQYAINDVIRVYLLPPLFVYGYLLPKMALHWLSVGMM